MRIFTWGANSKGQLGLGYCSEQVEIPQEIDPSLLDNFKLHHIQGGGSFTILIGESIEEPADAGTCKIISFPSTIIDVESILKEIQLNKEDIWATGWDFSIIFSSQKKQAYLAQCNWNGHGRESLRNVTGELDNSLVQLAAGLRHAVGIDINGHLYAYGDNSKGQLGLGDDIKNVPEFTRIPLNGQNHPVKFIKVRCGQHFTLALADDGHFYTTGLNKFGQLSLSPAARPKSTEFIKLPNFPSVNSTIKDFVCGWNHTLILQDNGQVSSFGRNNFGQLGRKLEDHRDCFIPNYIEDLNDKITSMSVGSEHNLALSEAGQVWTWGWNEHFNCGRPSEDLNDCILKPSALILPVKISYISCGAGNGFAVAL